GCHETTDPAPGPDRRDRLKPRKKGFVRRGATLNRGQRIVGELVVIAIVADVSGSLRKFTKIGLILLVKQSVLCRNARGHRLGIFILRENGKRGCEKEDQVIS